jgi:hypothetical protein
MENMGNFLKWEPSVRNVRGSVWSLWNVTSELKHLKPNSDYSHQFGCPASARRVIQKSVKQFRKTENVNILKRVCWLSVAIETCTGKVSDRLSETLHKSLWKLAQ